MLKYEKQILLIFTLLLSVILFFFIELKLSPDSKTYLRVSSGIVDFNSFFSLEEPLYLMSYLIFKLISLTENFEFVFKSLNLFSFLLIVIFTYKILKHYKIEFNNHFEYLFFLSLFFLNFEILQWTKFALTDLILVSLMLSAIYFSLKDRYFLSILIFLISALVKPQSIFIFFILFFIYFFKKKKNLLFFILYFSFYIFLILILFILDYLKLNLNLYIVGIADYIFIQSITEGNIVDDKYYIEYINFFSVFKIYFLRLISLYSVYFDDYSNYHKIYKTFYFSLMYIPIIFFIFNKNKIEKNIFTFFMGCITIISTFIILTFIDYDLRYRLYIFPFIIAISTYCLIKSNLIKKFINFTKRII